ncbi:hypothetical protein ABPG75_010364 [Micractinium tetrahymenae]
MQEEALQDKMRQQQQSWRAGWGREESSAAGERHGSGHGIAAQAARAWLRAVQQHERQWAALEASISSIGSGSDGQEGKSSSGGTLGLATVPWPPLASTEYVAGLAALEQQEAEQQRRQQRQAGAQQQEQEQRSAWQRAQRRAYARACLRWHPDKFEARWGQHLAAAERAAVLARVQEVSQGINAAWEQLQQEGGG